MQGEVVAVLGTLNPVPALLLPPEDATSQETGAACRVGVTVLSVEKARLHMCDHHCTAVEAEATTAHRHKLLAFFKCLVMIMEEKRNRNKHKSGSWEDS